MPEETASVRAYRILPCLSATDFAAYLRLLEAIEVHDCTGESVDEEHQRELLQLAGHDPAQDRWLAVDAAHPETLVGWASVWRAPEESQATLDGGVHPAWRTCGIGEALLTRALQRATALGAQTAGVYVSARLVAAQSFVEARGFQKVAANTLLHLRADVPLPSPVFPPGFKLLRFSNVRDVATLVRALDESYAGLWGHHVLSEEMVAHWLPQLDPDTIFLLFAPDATVAGMVRVELRPEHTLYLDAPGVVPAYRTPNLYRELLLAGLIEMSAQTPTMFEVESWGDLDTTLAEYRALGFEIVRMHTAYERTLF